MGFLLPTLPGIGLGLLIRQQAEQARLGTTLVFRLRKDDEDLAKRRGGDVTGHVTVELGGVLEE